MNVEERRVYLFKFLRNSDWYYDYRDGLSPKVASERFRNYAEFIIYNINELSYKEFLDNYFKTVDLYGLGLGLLYALDKSKHLLPSGFVNDIYALLQRMIHTNQTRRLHIDELLKDYETILSVLAKKVGYYYANNKLVMQSHVYKKMISNINNAISKKQHINKDKLHMLNSTRKKFRISRLCPTRKYYNLKTSRCNNHRGKK
jgi:hypothetical protein